MLIITIIIILYIIFFICFCCKLCYVLYKEHCDEIKKRKLDHNRLEMNTLIESKYYVRDGNFERLPSILEVNEYIDSDDECIDDVGELISSNNV